MFDAVAETIEVETPEYAAAAPSAIDARVIPLDSVTAPIAARRAAAVDAIADPRGIRAVLADNATNPDLPAEARVQFAVQSGTGLVNLGILPGAHIQIAERLQVPKPYYDRMFATAPQLLIQNINHWLTNGEPDRRLLRMFKPVTDAQAVQAAELGLFANLRAYLSNSYRALDHGALLDVVLPEALTFGARPTEAMLDDQRFRLKMLTVERNTRDLIRGHQTGHVVGEANEIVSMGVMISNSETGHGTLKVEPIMQILRCWTGLVVSVVDAMRVIHLGKKQVDEGLWVQDDTRRLDDAATFLKVRDRVRAVLSEETASTIATKMYGAMDAVIPTDIPLMQFVTSVSGKFDLTTAEVETLQEEVVGEAAIERTMGQTASAWTLSQGITAMARDTEDTERRIELQTMGWKVLEDPASFLRIAGKR